jgi:hypothetical protein
MVFLNLDTLISSNVQYHNVHLLKSFQCLKSYITLCVVHPTSFSPIIQSSIYIQSCAIFFLQFLSQEQTTLTCVCWLQFIWWATMHLEKFNQIQWPFKSNIEVMRQGFPHWICNTDTMLIMVSISIANHVPTSSGSIHNQTCHTLHILTLGIHSRIMSEIYYSDSWQMAPTALIRKVISLDISFPRRFSSEGWLHTCSISCATVITATVWVSGSWLQLWAWISISDYNADT